MSHEYSIYAAPNQGAAVTLERHNWPSFRAAMLEVQNIMHQHSKLRYIWVEDGNCEVIWSINRRKSRDTL